MESNLTREEAWNLLKTYNQEEFHLRHAVTVETVMRWYAEAVSYTHLDVYKRQCIYLLLCIFLHYNKYIIIFDFARQCFNLTKTDKKGKKDD